MCLLLFFLEGLLKRSCMTNLNWHLKVHKSSWLTQPLTPNPWLKSHTFQLKTIFQEAVGWLTKVVNTDLDADSGCWQHDIAKAFTPGQRNKEKTSKGAGEASYKLQTQPLHLSSQFVFANIHMRSKKIQWNNDKGPLLKIMGKIELMSICNKV